MASSSPSEFDYFMIRVLRISAERGAGTLSGVAERLGTGEKRSFASDSELLRIVRGESPHPTNMQSVGSLDNLVVSP
jgi:hypothetical protein